MGYTHYWTIKDTVRWEAIWAQLVTDTQFIISRAASISLIFNDEDEILEEDDKNKSKDPPDFKDRIVINDGYSPHETFILSQAIKLNKFQFCKTARKPYDLVVCTILIRTRMLAGKAFSFHSDGDWDSEYDGWVQARALYEMLWPGEELDKEVLGFEE